MHNQNRREYVPPVLREAFVVTRLANANWTRRGGHAMRYVLVCNVHEAIDPEQPLQVLDAVDGTHLSVAELLERLPEDLQRRVPFLA